MTATAHAMQPPAHAPAPPVQRKAEPVNEVAEKPQRLLASLSAVPAVQRQCATCDARDDEEETPIQPRLEVGPVDDPYEREADDIAGQVMAIRQPAIQRVTDASKEDTDAEVLPRPIAVQRKCTACDSDHTSVMPRLEVGPVDDPYEREADDIAGQVMAMRDPIRRQSDDAPEETILPRRVPILRQSEDVNDEIDDTVMPRRASVQRKCATCADEEEMPVQPRRAPASVQRMPAPLLGSDPLRDLADMPRMRPEAVAAGTEHIATSATQLTSGGSTLSGATREFFENRMGRDLSDVRIHRGTESQVLTESISARAFTFRNHIWLNSAETESPSFTMAHELAHVLQQTQPGPVGPNTMVRRRQASRAGRPTVRRVACSRHSMQFYFPKDETKTNKFHDAAVKHATGLTTNMRGEVRVPNANEKGRTFKLSGKGAMGFADLVEADSSGLVGLAFAKATAPITGGTRPWFMPRTADGVMQPVNLDFWRSKTHFSGGSSITGSAANGLYDSSANPRWGSNDFASGTSGLRHAGSTPTSLKIGDMKFAGGRDKAADATKQVKAYIGGFQFARDTYNKMVTRSETARAKGNTAVGSSSEVLPKWSLSAGATGKSTSPTDWTSIQTFPSLVIGKWVRKTGSSGKDEWSVERCDGSPEISGKMLYRNSPNALPLWEYLFWPNKTGAEFDETDLKMINRYRERANKQQEKMTASPAGPKSRRLPVSKSHRTGKPAVATSATSSAGSTPLVRPKKPKRSIPKKDPFKENFAAWETERKSLTTAVFGSPTTGATASAAISSHLHDIALQNTLREIGGKPPVGKKPKLDKRRLKKANKQLSVVYMMTGDSARYLGTMRKTMGSAFIKIVNLYTKLRTKFIEFMRNRKKSASGKPLFKAVMKVGGAIMAAIFHEIMPEVAQLLMDCVEKGLKRMLDRLLKIDIDDLIGGNIDKLQQELEKIEIEIETQINNLIGSATTAITSKYEDVIKFLSTLGSLINVAKQAFNAARAIACVAGGLETLGISCVIAGVDFLLSLVGASPAELLASSLLQTCVAQKLIGEHLLKQQRIKRLPRDIANAVVTTARTATTSSGDPILPQVVRDLFCDSVSANGDLPEKEAVTCGKAGSPGGTDASTWTPPPGVTPTDINREPTKGEVRKGGRFNAGRVAKRHTKQQPTTQPPATPSGDGTPTGTPATPPAVSKGPDAEPPVTGGTGQSGQATPGSGPALKRIVKHRSGTLTGPTASVSSTTRLFIGLNPSKLPRLGDTLPAKIELTTSSGNVFGPGPAQITLTADPENLGDGIYRLRFTVARGTILINEFVDAAGKIVRKVELEVNPTSVRTSKNFKPLP